ncbi:MAG: hypothetical protein A2785_03785 [Candidatus Chisholmbacteria bacterium RIFCSPHIGHO2_01_FULL_49_18]|uniref:Uncharacterized protein n=2 Tax=Candidatus Chisholmiibacteriota TaxID=1817900 RepID=A0A1G1VN84_9BACT|nr:MAG: hypothetical protein A2785_03785 [Candidatus Chisholmbacteria bacterium RIFCSPHIGHO2_01_FULL_49_18]OGY19447.1 MAG: hypothetical protein A3A65_06075 [Candidatus Chisholmbacteria bacterium RIFCSPLOWO2_01_FULL_49_14]
MERLGPAAVWRENSFRLNPGPALERMSRFNPTLPLSAATLPDELQEVVHDNLLEGQRAEQARDQGHTAEQTDIAEG